MLERRDTAAQQQQFPPIALLDPDSNKEVTLKAKHDTVSLGHTFSADASSEQDMKQRMAKADVAFYRAMHLWTSKTLKRRQKLRMWRTRNTAPNGLQLQQSGEVGVIMVYDSQYTKDQCTAPRPPGHARHVKNVTVIAVCRRLVQALFGNRVPGE